MSLRFLKPKSVVQHGKLTFNHDCFVVLLASTYKATCGAAQTRKASEQPSNIVLVS